MNLKARALAWIITFSFCISSRDMSVCMWVSLADKSEIIILNVISKKSIIRICDASRGPEVYKPMHSLQWDINIAYKVLSLFIVENLNVFEFGSDKIKSIVLRHLI